MPPGHYKNRIPVRNSDPVSTSMRDVPEHTTRIEQKIRSYSMGVTKYLIVNSPGHSEKSISESDSFITSAFRSVISTSRSPFNPFNPSNRKAQASPFRDDLCLPSGVLRCLPNSSSHTTVNGTVWPAIPVNAVQDITSQWR